MKLKFSLISLIILTACGHSPSNLEASRNTVAVTTLSQTSGGSGTVVLSTASASYILTNAHVCGAIANGGLVTMIDGKKAEIISFRKATVHDLCMVKVAEDLGTKPQKLAANGPQPFEDEIISGHPALYPTIVTRGHFAGKMHVLINTGFRECTPEEKADPVLGIVCAFVGRVPELKNYEAMVGSATIMPGSSGSGVFNRKGELSGVVFAGQGEIGYGLLVPVEYVHLFLQELRNIPSTSVNTSVNLVDLIKANSRNINRDFKIFCIKNPEHPSCKSVVDNFTF
jgi:S1-C subfamily serine protease